MNILLLSIWMSFFMAVHWSLITVNLWRASAVLPERAARPVFVESVNWNRPWSSPGAGERCAPRFHSPNPQPGSWYQLCKSSDGRKRRRTPVNIKTRLCSALMSDNTVVSEAPLVSPFSPRTWVLSLPPRCPFNYNCTRCWKQTASGAESRIYGTLFCSARVCACDAAFTYSGFLVTAADRWVEPHSAKQLNLSDGD